MRTQIWHPDTCGCVVEMQYDETLPTDDITFSVNRILKQCEFHSDLETWEDVFDTVMEENPRKNIAVNTFIELAPESLTEVDKRGNKRLKEDVELDFTFLPKEQGQSERKMELTLVGAPAEELSEQDQAEIQMILDTGFGDEKVIVKDPVLKREDIIREKTPPIVENDKSPVRAQQKTK